MNNKNSIIYLCKNIKLDRDYKNVLSYTEQEMLALCQNNAVASANNYSFIKHGENVIDVAFTYEDCLLSNYIAFQNKNYSNKWFFAFIDEVEYRNNLTTRIKFTIDEFSTWFDYWDPTACFVLREHVNDDSIGLHTLDEGLEFGDYVINTYGDVETDLDSTTLICIGTSFLPDNTPFIADNRVYGGVYSGTYYLLFRFVESASKFIKAMADIGHLTEIQCVFMMPLILANTDYATGWVTGNLGNQTGIEFKSLINTAGVLTLRNDITLSSPSTIDGYTPKNNRLFCYPYNALMISNNAGTMAEFKYEEFINNVPIFSLIACTPACSVWLFPNNYKKNETAKSGYNWGIAAAKYPQGSWQGDMYTNWLTQNGVNILGTRIDSPTAHAIMGSLQALTGAATGQYDAIGGGFASMFGAVTEQYRASMIPNQIGGQVTVGDITYAYNKMSPSYYKMTIKREYAMIIDDWLFKFGYKINRIKVPNQIGRQNFNYVKIGATEDIAEPSIGLPAKSLEIINGIYRSGVTIWHNHTNLGNFNVSNNIV